MPSEAAPTPRYRLNLKVVVMSILIWAGTFVVFAAISVTLAVTTNAMYFLFIIMGLVVSTFAMAFYKPEGPWEPMVPYTKLCEPKLETHAPIYVEERSSIYPPSPSARSFTRSDPWLCTSAKTTLGGSFSSPRLQRCSSVDHGLPSGPTIRDLAAHLPPGFLPLVPTGTPRSPSSVRAASPANCEEVKARSCHKPYGYYESRVTRTNYEEYTAEGCASEATEGFQPDATSSVDAEILAKPMSTVVNMGEAAKDAPLERKRRGLLWNIFGRSDEKPLVTELSTDASERDVIRSRDPLLVSDGGSEVKSENRPTGVANLPEYQKVVESIEKTIREANAALNVSKTRNSGDGAETQASDSQLEKQRLCSGLKRPSLNESSPDAHAMRGILNSTDSSTSECSGVFSFWRNQSPEATSRTRSSAPSASPSALSSTSRLTSGATTPRDSEHRYLAEAFFKTHSSWYDANPDSTTPFQNLKGDSQASTSQDVLPRTDVQIPLDERRIWDAPTPITIRVGEKASQTSLREFCLHSGGDDKDPFRMSPLVKADLVEVTVINTAAAPDGGQNKAAATETGDRKPPASKYVQATSKTVEASVQMEREVVTCDGDNNNPSKKSKRRRLKLLPRFLRSKKKK